MKNLMRAYSFLELHDATANSRFLYKHGEFAKYLSELRREPKEKNVFLELPSDEKIVEMAATVTKSIMADVTITAHSAVIVFLHTALDEQISELLVSLAELRPELWDEHIQGKTIQISELKESSIQEIMFKLAVKDALSQRRTCSLVQRLQLLFDKNKVILQEPGKSKFSPKEFKWLDELRMEIVHGSGLSNPVPAIYKKIEQCQSLSMHLFELVSRTTNQRYEQFELARILSGNATPLVGENEDL